MTALHWQSLRDGPDERVIATVDYGNGRREAGFPELVANLGGTDQVLTSRFDSAAIVSLGVRAASDAGEVDTETAAWCDDLLGGGRRPVALVSYCAGASLVSALAERLSERGVRPAVVLLEPIVVEPDFLLHRFVEAVQGFAAVLDGDEIKAAIRDAAFAVRSSPDRSHAALVGFARCLSDRYGRIARRACEVAGLDDEAAGEMHEHLAAVLHYQAVAGIAGERTCRSTGWERPRAVFLSAAHTPAASLPRATAVFPTERDDLLSDPRLAEAVTSAIGA